MKKSTATTALMVLIFSIVGCSTTPTPFALSEEKLEVMKTPSGVEFVRTPDRFFQNLPDWPYESKYIEIDGLRQAYIDEGPRNAEPILLLHGQPSWSYLYRRMIPVLIHAGYRAIAMDHLGMGRSDKPIDPDYYTYLGHAHRLELFIKELKLEGITTFVQDWGSLIGLYVVGTHPEWFERVVVGDGTLPVFGEGLVPFPLPDDIDKASEAFYTRISRIPAQQPRFLDEEGNRRMPSGGAGYFANWIAFSRHDERFRASMIVEAMTYFPLTQEERAAYDAPFPARITMAGPRAFPGLANTLGGKTAKAWVGLRGYTKPFLTIWAANDPGQLGTKATQDNLINNIPGAAGQPHVRLPEASHFLQDDQGAEIARLMVEFIRANPKK